MGSFLDEASLSYGIRGEVPTCQTGGRRKPVIKSLRCRHWAGPASEPARTKDRTPGVHFGPYGPKLPRPQRSANKQLALRPNKYTSHSPFLACELTEAEDSRNSQSGPPPEGQGPVVSRWVTGTPALFQGTAPGVLARPFLFSGGKTHRRTGWEIHPSGFQLIQVLTSPCSHLWAGLAELGPQGSAWETGRSLFSAPSSSFISPSCCCVLVFPPGSCYAPLRIMTVSTSIYFYLSVSPSIRWTQ